MADIYTEEEWQASAGHRPFRDLDQEDLALLHRHWIWSNQMRERFHALMQDQSLVMQMLNNRGGLAGEVACAMFLWYGLLFVVLEACLDPQEKRKLDFRANLRADIDAIWTPLKNARNAVFHVPRSGEYLDSRLFEIMQDDTPVARVHRVSGGFGRMFLEEFAARKAAEAGKADPA